MILSNEDRYALARAFAGMSRHPQVAMSAPVAMIVKQWEGRTPSPEDIDRARQFFGQEFIRQVFQADPNGKPPGGDAGADVPPLPAEAELDTEKIRQGKLVGGWLTEWMKYSKKLAAMTDELFLESGGLWLIGLAVARRIALKLDFQTIYPNLYALWVAPTTYYRKSTGLRVVEAMARRHLPHLLLAGQSSPEMLLYKLAGQRTTNYDELDQAEQWREEEGRKFAGQRGFISDEMSKLFSKKYMEGLPEIMMEMAEAPNLVEHEYKGMGKLVVRQAGLSLLFATTPARLQTVFGDGEWEDGLLPRFALLTPSSEVVARTPTARMGERHNPPQALVDVLNLLNTKLPQPEDGAALDDPKALAAVASVGASISDGALAGFNAYADALHTMTDPRGGLDFRLAGVYGRLPVHGLRVAICLAAMDWATAGGVGPVAIGDGHWWRAQSIVEKWRASSHRLLAAVNRSADEVHEERVMGVLRMGHAKPPTKHEIYKRAGIAARREAYATIDALHEAGVIVSVDDGSRTGYMLKG